MAMTNEGAPLPTSVEVSGTPRLTPNELRLLKQITGRNLSDLFADEADAMQAMVWLKLRRAGWDISWDAAGDVEAEMVAATEQPDPTKPDSSQTSLRSVDSGA